MKSVFDGYLSFGLVTFPIKLYAAVEQNLLQFKLLCGKCGTPVHYKRYCEKCDKELPWKEIVHGFELSKGVLYKFKYGELEKLRPAKSKVLEVLHFVPIGSIEPVYYNKHYYLVPNVSGDKAYALFVQALKLEKVCAIARLVMRKREHITAIAPFDTGLLLSTLNYSYEIRDTKKIEELKVSPKLNAKEVELARELVSRLSKQTFSIKEYKDSYEEKLRELLKRKLAGEEIEEETPKREKNLMKALEMSIKIAKR